MGFVVANELETFIGLIESRIKTETGATAVVDRENVKAFDEIRDTNWVNSSYLYIGISIPFTLGGVEYNFFMDSDRTGQGEFYWIWDTAEELFAYFEPEFLAMSEM